MGVGVKVGSIVTEVGASSFLNAFFSTIAALLENNDPGSRYPIISKDFYDGHVDANKVSDAVAELRVIHSELAKHPPSAIVWDIEDRSKRPPWGDKISPRITSMANYFMSSSGKDLFDLFFETFSHALKTKRSIEIVEV